VAPTVAGTFPVKRKQDAAGVAAGCVDPPHPARFVLVLLFLSLTRRQSDQNVNRAPNWN